MTASYLSCSEEGGAKNFICTECEQQRITGDFKIPKTTFPDRRHFHPHRI